MAERTHIPNSPACGRWETLLTDALDGLLAPADQVTFQEHMAGCKACSALYEDARRGREWLEFLSPEPEIPEGLVEQILARTGPGKASHGALAAAGTAAAPAIPTFNPAWQRPGFMGFIRRFAEPRLMMTAAMAFFSIALTLNLTGVRLTQVHLSQIHLSDLQPTAMRSFMERRISMASVPVIRYYDHLRFVYELQSRLRELQGEGGEESQPQTNPQPAAPSQPAAPGQSERNKKDKGPSLNPRRQPGEPVQANEHEFGDYVEASDEILENSGNLETSTCGEVTGNKLLGFKLLTIRASGSESYDSPDSFLARLNSLDPRLSPAASLSADHQTCCSTRAFRRLQNNKAVNQEGSRQWTALITRA